MIYLETERWVLRDWREEDSVVFSRMNRDPKVMEYFLKPLTDTESRDCCRSKNIREIYRLYRLTSYEF